MYLHVRIISVAALVAVGGSQSPLAHAPPALECGFSAPCADFITSTDNHFNTDTDVPWSRVSRLRTSTYRARAGDTFLAVWRPAGGGGGGGVTARLRTADPHLNHSSCLMLRFRLANASLDVRFFGTDQLISTTTSNSSEWLNSITTLLLPLPAMSGPLLLVTRLSDHAKTECGVDYVRFYRQTCKDVDVDDGPDPTWGPATTVEPPPVTSESEGDDPPGGAAVRRLAAPLTLLTAAAAAALITC